MVLVNRVNKNRLDVVYDSENDIWRCCSTAANGARDCSAPTSESFSAPAPDKLSTVFPEGTPTSQITSSFTFPPTSGSQNNGGGGGFSMSDKVALGVGIGVGVPGTLATIVGAVFTYLAVRKRSRKQGDQHQDDRESSGRPTALETSSTHASAPVEVKEEGTAAKGME